IMDSLKAQQMALDETLVATPNRLKTGNGNQRLSPDLKSNEATIQVVLDAHKLTLNFRDILNIYPKLSRERFQDPPVEEEILSDLGHSREIKVLTDVNGPRLKTQAKTKQPAKKTKAKGLTMLTKDALSEADQLKLATKRSKKDSHISHASGSSDGVGKLSKGDSEEEGNDDDDGNNDDEGGNDDEGDDVVESDDEQTESKNDDDGSDEEEDVEENDEEVKELYDDVNINLGNVDAEMTDGPRLKTQAKTKQPAKKTKAKGLTMLTKDALSEADQLKLATKRSKKDSHISHASGSSDGVGKLSKGDSEEEGNDDDDGNNDDEGGNDDEGDDVVESDDEQTESKNDDDGSDEEEDVEESAYSV
nr:hypothetical protein [Tanacetum cinerariifolium]